MTGSELIPPPDTLPWRRHDNGRWVVGEAGRQPEIEPSPAPGRAGTRPDTIIDGGRLDRLTFRATSQRGLAHQQDGKPRQDAYLLRPTPDRRWLIGCVSDGVSEGNLSHEAADAVCREATLTLFRGLKDLAPDQAALTLDADWPDIVRRLPWQDAAERASATIVETAREAVVTGLTRDQDAGAVEHFDQRPWTDTDARRVMSATAVAFVVGTRPVGDHGHPAAVAVFAGDSSAMLLDEGRWRALTPLKNGAGPLASTAVDPLPRTVHVDPVAHYLRPGQVLAVMTDGLGDPLGSGAGEVGAFLATQWSTPPDPLAFAYHVGFYRRSYTDDRTAVVIWADRTTAADAR
jgi:hypothetical protein